MPRLPRALRPPTPAEQRRRILRAIERRTGRRPGILGAVGRLDQRLLIWMRTSHHDPVTERTMRLLGTVGEWGAVWAAIGAAGATAQPHRRSAWTAAGAAGPASVWLNYVVKLVVGRERPVLPDHPPLGPAPSKLSFPSAHAVSSACGAAALSRVAPAGAVPLGALAAAICACRPYLGMHYPSDVAAGAVLGLAAGRLWPIPTEDRAARPAPREDGGE